MHSYIACRWAPWTACCFTQLLRKTRIPTHTHKICVCVCARARVRVCMYTHTQTHTHAIHAHTSCMWTYSRRRSVSFLRTVRCTVGCPESIFPPRLWRQRRAAAVAAWTTGICARSHTHSLSPDHYLPLSPPYTRTLSHTYIHTWWALYTSTQVRIDVHFEGYGNELRWRQRASHPFPGRISQ